MSTSRCPPSLLWLGALGVMGALPACEQKVAVTKGPVATASAPPMPAVAPSAAADEAAPPPLPTVLGAPPPAPDAWPRYETTAKAFERPSGVWATVIDEDGGATVQALPRATHCVRGGGEARLRLAFAPTGRKSGPAREIAREGPAEAIACLAALATREDWRQSEPFVLELTMYPPTPPIDTRK